MRLCSALAALVFAFGCKEPPPPVPVPELPPIERPALVSPRPIASNAAFDLVAVPSGVLLVWGQPSRLGGGVRAARLDPFGTVQRTDMVVFSPRFASTRTAAERIAPDALEISVAAASGRVGIVWLARDQTVLSIEAVIGDLNAETFSPRVVIGSTSRSETGGRGHVSATVAPDGRAFAFVRLADAPCPGGDAPCGTFGVYGLRPGAVSASGPSLVLPSPCERAVVGIGFAQSRFHYALCGASEGRRSTTLYSIEPEMQYARAEQVLPGCTPEGFLVTHEELLLVPGTCSGGRVGARLSRDADAMRSVELADEPSLRCEGEVPVLEGGGASGVSIRLDQMANGIESMLPVALAPRGARAVFTGRAILVASPLGGEVFVRRFQCEGGELVRTDVR